MFSVRRASVKLSKTSSIRHSSHGLLLNDTMYLICCGFRYYVMPLDFVVVCPFQDGLAGDLRFFVGNDASGFPIDLNRAPNSRATLAPRILVSGTRHKLSWQQSSFTARIQTLRHAPKVFDAKRGIKDVQSMIVVIVDVKAHLFSI